MKRFFTGAFALLLIFTSAFFMAPSTARADGFNLSSIYEPYALLVTADNPAVAYDGIEKGADTKIYPASTTKILTCIVALESGKSLDEYVTVSANAVDFGSGNSLMGLLEGDEFTLRDLLYGLMLPSGNDAAIAIAEFIGGDVSTFMETMNAKAQSLGMTSTHFVTPHGKQNEEHYTTARDMARLTAYALNDSPFSDVFRSIVTTKEYTASSGSHDLYLYNTNRMLFDAPVTDTLPNPISCLYADCIGVKTGDTRYAGKCLIAAASRDGVTMIAVLYGGTLDDADYDSGASEGRNDKYNARRFQDAAAMFDYAFGKMQRTVTVQDLIDLGLPVTFDITIQNASENDSNGGVLTVKADLDPSRTVTMMEPTYTGMQSALASDPSTLYVCSYAKTSASIADGEMLGTVTYSYQGATILTTNLLATRSVLEGTSSAAVVTNAPQGTASNLIAIEGSSGLDNSASEAAGSCLDFGNMTTTEKVCTILLPIIFLLLVLCLVMFFIYLRAEAKRRKRAAARRRAQQKRQPPRQ